MKLDFVCLGGNKCGTTWFYEMLNQHPEINPSTVKEPHYYTSNSNKSRDWYESGWDKSRAGLIGDFSTTYLYSTDGQLTMKRENLILKAFIVLRSPVERSVSHCRHLLRSAPDANISDFIKEHPAIIDNSIYFSRLQKAFEIFGEGNVKVLMYDELKSDPKSFLKKAFTFLGIDSSFVPENYQEVIGKGYDSKSKSLESFRIFVQRSLKSLGLGVIINLIKGSGVTKVGKGGFDTSLIDAIRRSVEAHNIFFKQDLESILSNDLLPEHTSMLSMWKSSLSNQA